MGSDGAGLAGGGEGHNHIRNLEAESGRCDKVGPEEGSLWE